RLNKTEKEKQSVLNLMIKYKSIEYAQRKAQAYSEKALKLFKKYTTKVKNKSAKKNIEELMRFVVNREK
ncbi:MAG: hypothetical protein NT091_04100, partial [Candidatus Falkowbacteria bacterium]|nr:hypothetical protein [Candidatus Falkowbacteria bacterium]